MQAAVLVLRLPQALSLADAVKLAGALDRMNVVSFELDPNSRYTFWSGITGGFFLALSYFGTDQSQVQRYLAGRSVAESRLGLLFNGMFKVPMQFVILFTGVLVFVFHVFTQPPIFFNAPASPSGSRVNCTAEASANLSRCRDTPALMSRESSTPIQPMTSSATAIAIAAAMPPPPRPRRGRE